MTNDQGPMTKDQGLHGEIVMLLAQKSSKFDESGTF